MALPDLNTDSIGPIGYWNFLENGGDSIDPTETESAMDSSVAYSNGIDGTVQWGISSFSDRDFNVRVKDDGWIIVWLDRTIDGYDEINLTGGSGHGIWNWADSWATAGESDITANHFSQIVNTLRQELSNSSQSTFNHSDVGFFDYTHASATNVSHQTFYSNDRDTWYQVDFTPNSEVTLHGVYIGGRTGSNDNDKAEFYNNDVNIHLSNTGKWAREVTDSARVSQTNVHRSMGYNSYGCSTLIYWS